MKDRDVIGRLERVLKKVEDLEKDLETFNKEHRELKEIVESLYKYNVELIRKYGDAGK